MWRRLGEQPATDREVELSAQLFRDQGIGGFPDAVVDEFVAFVPIQRACNYQSIQNWTICSIFRRMPVNSQRFNLRGGLKCPSQFISFLQASSCQTGISYPK